VRSKELLTDEEREGVRAFLAEYPEEGSSGLRKLLGRSAAGIKESVAEQGLFTSMLSPITSCPCTPIRKMKRRT
jgi:hypothetical protein